MHKIGFFKAIKFFCRFSFSKKQKQYGKGVESKILVAPNLLAGKQTKKLLMEKILHLLANVFRQNNQAVESERAGQTGGGVQPQGGQRHHQGPNLHQSPQVPNWFPE